MRLLTSFLAASNQAHDTSTAQTKTQPVSVQGTATDSVGGSHAAQKQQPLGPHSPDVAQPRQTDSLQSAVDADTDRADTGHDPIDAAEQDRALKVQEFADTWREACEQHIDKVSYLAVSSLQSSCALDVVTSDTNSGIRMSVCSQTRYKCNTDTAALPLPNHVSMIVVMSM